MPSIVNQRVNKHRASLRAAGLRPIQIWVPDTRAPGFEEECRRQSRLAAEHDTHDHETKEFMDALLHDIEGWQP